MKPAAGFEKDRERIDKYRADHPGISISRIRKEMKLSSYRYYRAMGEAWKSPPTKYPRKSKVIDIPVPQRESSFIIIKTDLHGARELLNG